MGTLGQSLCNKLNTTSYPKLWIKLNEAETTAFAAIATSSGLTKTMKIVMEESYKTMNDALVLSSTTSTSNDAIEKFLAGTNVANYNTGPLNVSNALLKRGTVITYITDYLYGASLPDPLSQKNQTNLNSINNTTSGRAISSVLDSLINDSLLLKENELYSPPGSTGKAENNSLIHLYQSGTKLSTSEVSLKTTLEQRNLRFFAAFLMEYCFYRTRYFYMLTKYFDAFKDTSTNVTYTTLPTPTSITTASDKTGYMTRLAYHMAHCNMIMADMRKLLKAIHVKYDTLFETIRTTLQSDTSVSSDTTLRNSVVALQTSAEKLKTYVHETDFRKAAMEYNAEKNRYGSMLLGLYAILNLSALAMIYKLR